MRVALAVCALIATPAFAHPSRVYSNVCQSRDTGDQGGVELVLSLDNGQPSVDLKVCEGGCWMMPTRAVTLTGDALSFIAEDKSFDANGKLTRTTPRAFTGVIQGKVLRLASAGYRNEERLKRRPHQLAVADAAAWPAPVERCR